MQQNTPTMDELYERNQTVDVTKKLEAGEDIQKVIEANFNKEHLFKPTEIRCPDGRVHKPGMDLDLAGSGVFLSKEQIAEVLKRFPDLRVITTHDHCGAGKIAFEQAQKERALPEGITDADTYVKYWGEKMAQELGLEHRHINESEFIAADHHEQGIMLDATGDFHPVSVDGLPNMFVTHAAAAVDPSYAATEVKTLTNIAFSDHGIGGRLTADNKPFNILVSAGSEDQKQQLVNNVREAVKDFGDRVKVEGFIVSR